MNSNDWKLWKLVGAINGYFQEHQKEITTHSPLVVIKRYDLRLLLVGSMEKTGTHTLNRWMDYALAKGYLIQNPTSHLLNDGKSIRPDNDTRYFINVEMINQERERLLSLIRKADAQRTAIYVNSDNSVDSDKTQALNTTVN